MWKYNIILHLVFHSSSDLERFLRVALCFSSNLFFSSLARSTVFKTKLFNLWMFQCSSFVILLRILSKTYHKYINSNGTSSTWKHKPMSPFSIACMSGLSLLSVFGMTSSISLSSSLSCIANVVKLYIFLNTNKTKIKKIRKLRFQRMQTTAFVAYFDNYKNDFQSSRGYVKEKEKKVEVMLMHLQWANFCSIQFYKINKMLHFKFIELKKFFFSINALALFEL